MPTPDQDRYILSPIRVTNRSVSRMRFRYPTDSIEFEIPDPWWVEANAHRFERSTNSFAATSNPDWPTTLVSIKSVAPPQRNPGILGLRKERTISLLKAIVCGDELPPLPPQSEHLTVRDGFHRYFISVALGFPMLPVSVRPYFEF
jgi:hypothetical protein